MKKYVDLILYNKIEDILEFIKNQEWNKVTGKEMRIFYDKMK